MSESRLKLTLDGDAVDLSVAEDVRRALALGGYVTTAQCDLSPRLEEGTYLQCVGGTWARSASQVLFPNVAPAESATTLGVVLDATVSETNAACDLAELAFDAWRATSGDFRTKAMLRVGELLRDHTETLCALVTREMGKTLYDARLDVLEAIGVVEAVAPQGLSMTGDTYPQHLRGVQMECRVAPRGPAGIITPFNFPIAIPVAQLLAALVSGNPVVWKPSHLVPESSQAIATLVLHALDETATRMGVTVPRGVFSLLLGDATAGDALVRHPAIRTVSFTGSKAVGDAVGALGESLGKRVMKECGGINLFYVHASADLDRAARNFVYGKTITAGQRCTAIQEVLCDAEVLGAFVERARHYAAEIVMAPGASPVLVGRPFTLPPLVSAEQLDRYEQLVAQSVAQGATVLYSGAIPEALRGRGFYAPFLMLGDVHPHNVLYGTEVFGPCGVITRVSGLPEAIRLINAKIGIVGCIDARDKDASETFLDRVLRTRMDDGRHGTGALWATKFGGDRGAGSGNPALDEGMVYGYCVRKTIYRAYEPLA